MDELEATEDENGGLTTVVVLLTELEELLLLLETGVPTHVKPQSGALLLALHVWPVMAHAALPFVGWHTWPAPKQVAGGLAPKQNPAGTIGGVPVTGLQEYVAVSPHTLAHVALEELPVHAAEPGNSSQHAC